MESCPGVEGAFEARNLWFQAVDRAGSAWGPSGRGERSERAAMAAAAPALKHWRTTLERVEKFVCAAHYRL